MRMDQEDSDEEDVESPVVATRMKKETDEKTDALDLSNDKGDSSQDQAAMQIARTDSIRRQAEMEVKNQYLREREKQLAKLEQLRKEKEQKAAAMASGKARNPQERKSDLKSNDEGEEEEAEYYDEEGDEE